MNKYINCGLLCVASALLFASCSDVMDTKPTESYDDNLVWGTEATADAFALGVYKSVVPYFTGSVGWEVLTPNSIQCSQVGDGWNKSTLSTEEGLTSNTNYGFGRFPQLRACNLLIEKAQQAPNLSERKRAELIAEGRLLRGMLFFDMTRKMGRFVPIMRVLTQDDKESFKQLATKTTAESYQIVLDDLTAACEGLPEISAVGRANKYAAHLMRSRASLQAYAYTGEAKYLDLAIASAKAVTQKYRLTQEYGKMFDGSAISGGEVVWGRYYLSENYTVASTTDMIRTAANIKPDDNIKAQTPSPLKNANGNTFECWGTVFPTQDLVDQYLVVDQRDHQAKPWYETSQFLDNVDVLDPETVTSKGQIDTYTRADGNTRNIPSTQDLVRSGVGKEGCPLFRAYYAVKPGRDVSISELMYNHRDKRMDATILRDGSTFLGEYLTMNLNGNVAQGVRDREDGGWYNTSTGYYWRKPFRNSYSSGLNASVKTDYHFVLARAGEAFLNLAEAELLKGNIAEAVEALNQTRTIHGGLPASTASTIEEAWQDYMRERRVEMAFENGDIYFSYLRWGKYGGPANYGRERSVGQDLGAVIKDLNRPLYKIQISRDYKKVLIGQVTLSDVWNRNFTARRYLFPIPQGEIDKRQIYGIQDAQNPGW